MRRCKLCGKVDNIQSHHVVSRKQQPALIDCEFNQVDLCIECHTSGPNAVHNGGFKELKKLRLEKQRDYYVLFDEDFYTKEIIKEILEIRQRDVDKLLRPLIMVNGMYRKEDVIRECMGGKLMLDFEI